MKRYQILLLLLVVLPVALPAPCQSAGTNAGSAIFEAHHDTPVGQVPVMDTVLVRPAEMDCTLIQIDAKDGSVSARDRMVSYVWDQKLDFGWHRCTYCWSRHWKSDWPLRCNLRRSLRFFSEGFDQPCRLEMIGMRSSLVHRCGICGRDCWGPIRQWWFQPSVP